MDWNALLRVGLHELKLNPEVFWGLTPVELVIMATGVENSQPALGRVGLEALSARFPDN
ncbi:MAG: phage tail assembly chaperone [Rhodobacteraceae bacterium]|nr:phage tail assembly chaperone [Paracoccaceae bacterium]